MYEDIFYNKEQYSKHKLTAIIYEKNVISIVVDMGCRKSLATARKMWMTAVQMLSLILKLWGKLIDE